MLFVLPGIMPMLRSGSKDFGEGGAGVTCAGGGGTGDVGVAFMKPKADPGAAAALEGGSEAALEVTSSTLTCSLALLTVMFPNKSLLEPLFATGVEFIAVPPKKSPCCCCCCCATEGGEATGAAADGCCGADVAALVFNPLNNAPPPEGAELPTTAGLAATGTGAAGSSKSNKFRGGATGAATAAAGAAKAAAAPFIIVPLSIPNAINTLFAGPFTLALA
mmetsp:Transcript_5860/g.10490  ORF Transcript_5860/g.10490 Transcript_5860/m.10490 type:complete len:220 (-) Transcript_5860:1290-1949(-)